MEFKKMIAQQGVLILLSCLLHFPDFGNCLKSGDIILINFINLNILGNYLYYHGNLLFIVLF